MRYLILALSMILFAACAPVQGGDTPPPAGGANQPHLPPPGLPNSTPVDGERYCGDMRGNAGQTCETGEYCHRDVRDMCGAADAPGRCRTLPQVCTMDYNPVCGCDGQTYPNECAANAKGVSAAAMGECP